MYLSNDWSDAQTATCGEGWQWDSWSHHSKVGKPLLVASLLYGDRTRDLLDET